MTGMEPTYAPTELKRSTLREQTTESIRTAIVTGALVPCRVYTARTVAEQLNVSVTPVREALLELANYGLVEVLRNRGFRIPELSRQDLVDLYQLRSILEQYCVELLASEVEATIASTAWRSCVDLCRATEELAGSGDLTAFPAADRAFHLSLVAAVGNRQIVTLVGQLRDRSRLYRVHAEATRDTLLNSAREHAEILAAIEAGDPARARGAVRQHIEHSIATWTMQP